MEMQTKPHMADGVVDLASRNPWRTMIAALVLMVAFLLVARRLELRTELLELLPRDSPGFKAFEHQSGRIGGGSNLTVIVSSPSRSANEKFVDALASKLGEKVKVDRACVSKCVEGDAGCKAACNDLISYVEATSKDLRAYYENNKWLYASLEELRKAEEDLDWNIATQSGMVTDLGAEERPSSPAATSAPAEKAVAASSASAPTKKSALGLKDMLTKWDEEAKKKDNFPTGYFATPDSKLLGIRIIANTSLGGAGGDMVLAEVQRMVAALQPATFEPTMEVGYTGDIASASDEKQALMSEALWATLAAAMLILAGLVWYYRSVWSLLIIFVPAILGVAAAYAFATVAFGYINTSGAFLGAIILGNGINYPIVLLSRYQDFRAHGVAADIARRAAVANAFRAELVGACVASIAYGSLTVTHFRGFSQFGVIGFVGMLLVWLAIVPLVPAMLVLVDRVQSRIPESLWWLRDRPAPVRADGSRSRVISWVSDVTTRHPWAFLTAGAVMFFAAAYQLPSYLKDPWEYNFDKLGAKSSGAQGAGLWSLAANKIYGRGNNISGAAMLADTIDQVPLLKKRMFENDAADPEGPLLQSITTIFDMLPGTVQEQEKKLEILEDIRSKLTERVLSSLSDEERADVERARPPETLRVLSPNDLPPLVRRRFTESNGTVGTVFYIAPRDLYLPSDGRHNLRLAATTGNVRLADGTVVMTASRSTIFAEMLSSMRRDGPLVSGVAFAAVSLVVLLASRSKRSVFAVLLSLVFGVVMLVGGAAYMGININYINFIAIPITLGIGCEYPFNIADRVRLLGGDVAGAVKRSAGAVLLCSFSTVVGYGSMMYSDFQALESFGKLAVFGEIACVFGAVFFLPSLMMVLLRSRQR